jgi:tRNA wybutosine-synthesizing protein 1
MNFPSKSKNGPYLTCSLLCPAGVPGVRAERLEEGMEVKHCALSLVGEPIMYPEINRFLKLLHQCKISSFLVTNAQFPMEIR